MPATYEPIATTTLSSAASSITFSSITGSYTDLVLVFTGSVTSAGNTILTFNSDTGANYSNTRITGDGSTVTSGRTTGGSSILMASTGTAQPLLDIINIFSYAGSTNKTVLVNCNNDLNGSGQVRQTVGLWRHTSAITSITYATNAGNLTSGSTATLYGIKAA